MAHEDHSRHEAALSGSTDRVNASHRVPDEVAWRIFFRSLAGTSKTQEEIERQASLLNALDLDEEDAGKLRAILADFVNRTAASYEQIQAVRVYTPELETMRSSISAATTRARSDLGSRLSSRGVNKVRQYLDETVRPNIVAIPYPSAPLDK
jgi:hypothetical protein